MADDPWADFKPQAAPAQAVDPWAEFSPKGQTEDGLGTKIVKSLGEGGASLLKGNANSIRKMGYDSIADKMDAVAGAIEPTNAPHWGEKAADSNTSFMDRIKNIPGSILESSPGLAQDLATGAAMSWLGGPELGGTLGFLGSNLLRNYGPNLDRAKRSDNLGPDEPSTTSQQLRAGVASGADALLSKLGVGAALGTPIKEVGSAAIKPIIGQVLKAGATDAAVNAGMTTSDKALLDKDLVSPSDLVVSGLQGGGAGLAVRGAGTIRDTVQAAKYAPMKDLSPDSLTRVGNQLQNQKYGNDREAEAAVRAVATRVSSDIDNASQQTKIGPQLEKLSRDSQFTDDTQEVLNRVKDQLQSGQKADPSELQDLKDRLGGSLEGDTLVNHLSDLHTLNTLKDMGNYVGATSRQPGSFEGGLASTDFVKNWIAPLGKYSKFANIGEAVLGTAAMGMPGLAHAAHVGISPTTAFGLLGGQIAGHQAIKVVDRGLGLSNPVETFVNKFAGNDPPALSTPSFRQGVLDQAAQAKQDIAQSRQEASNQAQTERIGSGLENNVVSLAKATIAARKRAQAQTNIVGDRLENDIGRTATRNVAEAQQQAQAAAQNPYEQTNWDPSSDITTALKLERMKQGLEDDRLKNLGVQSKRMAASTDPTSDATTAIKVAKLREELSRKSEATEGAADEPAPKKVAIRDQENPMLPGVTNAETSSMRRAIKGIFKKEGIRAKAEARAARETTKAERAAKASEPKAEKAPKDGTEKVRAQARAEAKANAPKSESTFVDHGDTYSASARGITVTQPKSDVAKPQAWANSTVARLNKRGKLIDAMRKTMRSREAKNGGLTQLERDWAHNDHSRADGYHRFESFVNDYAKEGELNHLFDLWNNHKIESTWNK